MNKEFNQNLDDIVKLIRDKDKIYIMSHVNPDGDNIGSTLALTLALKKMNKEVYPLLVDDIPSYLKFLPGIELYEEFNREINSIDLIITLDSSDKDRLGKYKDLLDISKKVINIDHHISNTNFGQINLVDSKASATGEIVYDLIKKMDIVIDKDIGTLIYTAISTDTGSFKYDNVTDRTHEIIADLIRVDIDKSYININLYESRSMESTNLFIKVISTLKTYYNDKMATISVTKKMLEETNTSMEDAEGIISFVRGIKGVEVACIFKEVEEREIKVSMRSKEYVDVAELCSNFEGGGHIRAAGCTLYDNIQDAEARIIEKAKEYFR